MPQPVYSAANARSRERGFVPTALDVLSMPPNPPTASAPPRRLLLIQRDNIGDLVLSTPFIRVLRARYPSARIDALVNSYNAPVLERNPHVDSVFAYTKW